MVISTKGTGFVSPELAAALLFDRGGVTFFDGNVSPTEKDRFNRTEGYSGCRHEAGSNPFVSEESVKYG